MESSIQNQDYTRHDNVRGDSNDVSEGRMAKSIERQTARIPSDTFLWLALGSMGVSLTFQAMGRKETSTFIGQWAPTLLILGVYNKLVKVAGSDRFDRGIHDDRDVSGNLLRSA
jgi:hypothetical protein